MTKTLTETEPAPMVLHTRPAFDLDAEQFFQFCRMNDEWQIERTARGDIVIMPPAGGETGSRNSEIARQLGNWARQDGTGVAFDSSTGFDLPNGATRSPDASWVRRSRLAALTPEQKQRFLPLCPDFVVELRSPSDSLTATQDKMEEYLANGALLGLLIDPPSRHVYVYRPNAAPYRLDDPAAVSADPELPAFTLDLAPIFTPNF